MLDFRSNFWGSEHAVSWLKIKPKVLIFPSKSSRFTATFTHTTIKSLSLFLLEGMTLSLLLDFLI